MRSFVVIVEQNLSNYQAIYNNAGCLMLALNMSQKEICFFISQITYLQKLSRTILDSFLLYTHIIYRLSFKLSPDIAENRSGSFTVL